MLRNTSMMTEGKKFKGKWNLKYSDAYILLLFLFWIDNKDDGLILQSFNRHGEATAHYQRAAELLSQVGNNHL